MSRIRRHLTFANVASATALFMILGGGIVYAAGKIGSGDIKRNAILSRHLKNGEVRARDLADGSITGSKLDPGTRKAFARAGGGQTTIDSIRYARDAQSPPQSLQLFSRGGLTLTAQCEVDDLAGLLSDRLRLTATTAVDDAQITTHYGQVGDAASQTTGDDDFDATDAYQPLPFRGARDTAGSIVYTTRAGEEVAIDFQADEASIKANGGPLGGASNCLFAGVALTVLGP